MNTGTWQSIGAVVAGVFFVVIVTTLVDVAFHVAKIYPAWDQPLTDALALLASSYRLVISIVGAFLTAKLAPAHPMKHALILGFVGLLLGLAGVVATWDAGLGPRWYPISLAVLAIPQCWVGGRIYELRSRARLA